MNQHMDSSPAPSGRVAVGMSGGLDSSAVAALCVDQGWDVMGLTLHMFKEGSRCCSIEDVDRARRICDHLGIPHYVVNAIDAFEERIIGRFLDEYARGRTPSPCVLCNEHIKFGILHERARDWGCSHVATGHYARVRAHGGAWELLRPRDHGKDQTYFLHRLSQDQLSRCIFPLEAMTKVEVAAYAEAKGLPLRLAPGSESQDLCFVPDDGHALFVEERRPGVRRSGAVVNAAGDVLGKHEGVHRFTVGQRRGLGVASTARLYVTELDADENRVVLGPRDEVMARACTAEDMHWISGAAPAEAFSCTARVRYRHEAAGVEVQLLPENRVRLEFAQPQFAITPGQAAVLYDGDRILGGGWIEANRSVFEV
jgi:tRNA-specific 2-thiouridylase